jgi:hypothetical protein
MPQPYLSPPFPWVSDSPIAAFGKLASRKYRTGRAVFQCADMSGGGFKVCVGWSCNLCVGIGCLTAPLLHVGSSPAASTTQVRLCVGVLV